MPAYRIFLGFSAKRETLIFVWIFMCVDFYGKIKTKRFAEIAHGTT